MLLSGSLLTAGGAAPGAAALADQAGAAPAVRPMAAGDSRVLNGIYCTSASNCWAVGSRRRNNATLNEVLHRGANHRWRRATVPNPAGTAAFDDNELNAVRCTSASNCWAVGSFQRSGSGHRDQLLHWNGKKWKVLSAPAPGGTSPEDFNQLADVGCTSATRCWAVGYYGIDMTTSSSESVVVFTQALRWKGRKWTLVTTPNPGGHSQNHVNQLNAVRCRSARNCWAAGTDGRAGQKLVSRNLMLHWNGVKWTSVKVPNPGGTANQDLNQINGLSCTSAKNCWAAGSYGKDLSAGHAKLVNEVLHWNGKKWVNKRVPNPDGSGSGKRNQLTAVTCTTARNCWAVGWTGGLSGRPGLNEALHWKGKKWSVTRTPNGGGTGGDTNHVLESVRCTSAANCWAVGVAELSHENDNQILRWNGTTWLRTKVTVAR